MNNLKKITCLLLVCFMIISGTSPVMGAPDVKFEGEVIQKYDFYDGDVPTESDFTINGVVAVDEPDSDIKYNDFEVFSITKLRKKDDSYYVGIVLLYTPPNSGSMIVSFDQPVKVVPFSKKVKQNIKNGQVIKKNIKSEEDIPTIKLTGATGRRIENYVQYSSNYIKPIYGYNDITWTTTPKNEKYGKIKGNFTLYRMPTFKLQTYPYAVLISGLDINYHQVKVNNGKWQNLSMTVVNGLKPNTKYKIQIRQKATKTRKATVLKVYNVKTPKA